MKPHRKRDSLEVAELSMKGKGQDNDTVQGTDAENGDLVSANIYVANNGLNQPSTYETIGIAWSGNSSSSGDLENSSEQYQNNSAVSLELELVVCGVNKTTGRQSPDGSSIKVGCEVERGKKTEVEASSELEQPHNMRTTQNEKRGSHKQNDCNEMREPVTNSKETIRTSRGKLVRKNSDEEIDDISEDAAKVGEKGENVDKISSTGNIELSRNSVELTSPQTCVKLTRKEKLDLSDSIEENRIPTPSKLTGLQNSSDHMRSQTQKIQNNFIDKDKAMNQSKVGDGTLSDSFNKIRFSQSMKNLCHNIDNAADKCEAVTQYTITKDNPIMTLRINKMCPDHDKTKHELHINEVNTNVDSHCAKTEMTYSEGCHIHVNSGDLFVRKRRRSVPSSENITPEKLRRFEKSDKSLDIWGQMEDLCTQSLCQTQQEVINSSPRGNILAQNFSFSHSSEDGLRPELLPVNRKFILTKFLMNQDGLLHNHPVKQTPVITETSYNKTRSEMHSDTDYDMEAGTVMSIEKTQHESLRNNGHRRTSYSSCNWPLKPRTRSQVCSNSCRCSLSEKSSKTSNQGNLGVYQPRRRYNSMSSSRSSCSSSSSHCSSSRSTSCSRMRSCSQSNSESLSGTFNSLCKYFSPDIHHVIKTLLQPLVLPASATTLFVAPVTGSSVVGKPQGGHSKGGGRPENNSTPDESSKTASGQSEKSKEAAGLHDSPVSNAGNKLKCDSKETSSEANAGTSGTLSSPNVANSSGSASKPATRNPSHRAEHLVRNLDHVDENFERQRYQQAYEHSSYNHSGYHSTTDPYFSEDTGYENFEFDGAEYDNFYDEGQDEYSFSQDSYHHPSQRPPGPNMHYPRRPLPQGFRGPLPQMYAPNGPGFGPRGPGMGPRPRMGPNGPMGPQGHRPQIGPGGPMGPGMRGPSRGPPYGPPRQMRPQGMRGPPAPGMMGSAGQIGRGGPYPRFGPTPRNSSPMPRHSPQTPAGPRPRMGPPVSGPPPRDGQYPPPRSGLLQRGLMLNLSQPPPNFNVSPSPALSTSTGNSIKVPDAVEPPPLPPPKPPTPKPPPPPKKEEEKKEEIKPMAPLIPPEQAEQYRRLREQARKHARKQLRNQEHRAKGEPESSDEDDEEKAKRKEYEARLAAEREDMEKAAMLAAQDDGGVTYDEGATILMPAPQPALLQQPTYVFQHHPMTTLPSSYGMMSAPHFVHSTHPALHPSQLQNLQFMTSPTQPQLVQLPNGQVAYASPAPLTYQAMAPMVSMSPQGITAAGMPHQMMLSSGGMHQVPVATHPGISVGGNHYMSHVMAAQIQAAQQQAAAQQAAQVQAAQQAAQVQAAQVQAAQVHAAQAQQAQLHGLVPGVHMAQHVMPAISPQGQIILVPRVARPQM